MGDWPVERAYNHVVISTMSLASIGIEIGATVPPSFGVYPAASRAYFIPFSVYQPTTVVKMFLETGVSTAGEVEVGIYSDNGVRLVTSGGASTGPISSIRELEITDTVLNRGLYYLAMVQSETATSTSRMTANVAQTRSYGVVIDTAGSPLPAQATFAAASGTYLPVINAILRATI